MEIGKTVTFEIVGVAKGKGRPRFRSTGRFVQTYTDKDTATWENYVRMCFINSGGEKLNGNLSVLIQCNFPIPKSVSKKKHAELLNAPYPHKPDCDNLAKSILDALNGIAFDDDAQVTVLVIRKLYSEEVKTVVTIGEMEGRYEKHVVED